MVDTLSPSQLFDLEMDDHGTLLRNPSRQRLLQQSQAEPDGRKLAGVAKHTLGLILLLCVVLLWTMCNFLGSVRRTLPLFLSEKNNR